MRTREELIGLLKEIDPVLDAHWFSDVDGESYNNEDVIAVGEKVKAVLREEES